MHWRAYYRAVLLLLLASLTGCGSGSSFGLFPDRYPLGEAAIAERQLAPAELPRELNKAWLANYTVEPGDGLLISPIELDSKIRLPADQTILPDGSIDLGKYGKLTVAGKTIPEIEEQVLKTIAKKEKAEDIGYIDVRLVNRASKNFYVLGEVTTPGKYQFVGSETVLDAIIMAGGLNDRSSWRDIILVRPSPEGPGTVLRVNYGEIIRVGNVSTNYQLQPGDRIYIGSRSLLDSLLNCDRHN